MKTATVLILLAAALGLSLDCPARDQAWRSFDGPGVTGRPGTREGVRFVLGLEGRSGESGGWRLRLGNLSVELSGRGVAIVVDAGGEPHLGLWRVY